MRKLLSALFALILVVSLLVPIFTLADETGLSDAVQSASNEILPTPSGDVTPTPSGEATPTPSGEVTPTPSSEATPTPSGEVTPTPSGEATPTPSGEVTPTPSDEASPAPSGEASPAPSDEASPSPSEEASPSPYAGITVPAELYKIYDSLKTDDEINQFLESLSDEQIQILNEYIQSEETKSSVIPEIQNFTDAGPLIDCLGAEKPKTQKPLLRRSLASAVAAPAAEPIKNTDGVELSKTVTKVSDSEYSIRLESYTTGAVTTVVTNAPADIVLVLDQSYTMTYAYSGSTSRQTAMKSAVLEFVQTLKDQNTNHRVALVTFGVGSNIIANPNRATDTTVLKNFFDVSLANDYSKLRDAVNGLNGSSSGTNTDSGMSSASTLINGLGNNGRNKVVIVFTDGVPTSNSATFDTGVADRAIGTSKGIKNTANTTVYTIGIFSGADPSQLYGAKFDYDNSVRIHVGFLHWIYPEDVPCNGEVNDIWGTADNISDNAFVDIAAGNRFLNYLSSNYLNAEIIGINKGTYNPGGYNGQSGDGYQITTNYTPNPKGSNYYLTAGNASSLNDAFTSISTQIGAPTTQLGNAASVKDIVSQYFDAPADIAQISVYTVDCTGKTGDTYNWGSEQSFIAAKTINAGTITISGFSYDDNYVTAEVKPNGGGHGKKLVICFNVTVRAGFWGGNLVPTNGSDSGLYADNTLIENFARPTVNVPLSVPFSAKDFSIYLGTSVSSSSMYNAIAPGQEWMDDYVNTAGITYSPTNQTYSLTADKTDTTVSATVSPLYSGSVSPVTLSDTSTICVYKPVITYSDSQIYLGEKASYPESLSITWMPPVSVTPAPAVPSGPAPVPTASYSPGADWFSADTRVDATIKVGDWDITSFVTFKNNTATHTGDVDASEFTVHVKTCSLTVSKSGISGTYGDRQTFIFHITGVNIEGCKFANDVDLTVLVGSQNASKQIVGLPVGIYTVTEVGGWSWRYTAAGSAALTLNKDTDSLGIANTLNKPKWLSGCNFASNIFN